MRYAILIPILMIVHALVLQGCTSTAPPPEPRELQVEFSSGAQQYSTANAEAVEVIRQTEEQLEVSGSMLLPSPCFEVKASGMAYPDSVLLTIEATPTPQMCAMTETILPYQALIQSPVGDGQELRVKHAFTGADHLARTFQVRKR